MTSSGTITHPGIARHHIATHPAQRIPLPSLLNFLCYVCAALMRSKLYNKQSFKLNACKLVYISPVVHHQLRAGQCSQGLMAELAASPCPAGPPGMEPAGHQLGGRLPAVGVGAGGALAAAARLPEPAGGALSWDGKAHVPGWVGSSRALAVGGRMEGSRQGRAGQHKRCAWRKLGRMQVTQCIMIGAVTGI
jgi:hypothetical protein